MKAPRCMCSAGARREELIELAVGPGIDDRPTGVTWIHPRRVNRWV